jgi:hypothetical protein
MWKTLRFAGVARDPGNSADVSEATKFIRRDWQERCGYRPVLFQGLRHLKLFYASSSDPLCAQLRLGRSGLSLVK